MNLERKKIAWRHCNTIIYGTVLLGVFGVIVLLFAHGTGLAPTDSYSKGICTFLGKTEQSEDKFEFEFNVETEDNAFNTSIIYDDTDQAIMNQILSWDPPHHQCWIFHHTECDGTEEDKLYFEYPMKRYTLTIIFGIIVGFFWLIVLCHCCIRFCVLEMATTDLELGNQMGFFRRYSRRANHRQQQRSRRHQLEEEPEIIRQQYITTKSKQEPSESSSSEDSENECSICIRRLFKEGKAITQPSECCGTIFHEKCLMEWFEQHNTCPMCQSQIIED